MTYYRKTTHSTFDCTYHIIWITKYRYNILVGDIAERAREILRQVCVAQNVEIIR
ncbi:transposase, partial [Patescibacteria group bacterium]|nr:transposase [Patescibacteria group bacterium]